MLRAFVRVGLVAVLVVAGAGCQSYDFVHQADQNRRVTRLRFAVETPSKADVLFVIDNSPSMGEEQAALAGSVGQLLAALGPNDTSYRIGIVSTDTMGWTQDCANVDFDVSVVGVVPTARGDCTNPAVTLRRPHDGVKGRLLAAYDATKFNPASYAELDTPEEVAAFGRLVPTAIDVGPLDGGLPYRVTGEQGVPWVIDRDVVRADACKSCGCTCSGEGYKDSACYVGCVEGVSTALVKAYFTSSVAGLGVHGQGWEQGIEAALLAVGINPDLVGGAVDPPGNNLLTYNRYRPLDPPNLVAWLRPEAVLGVMFVSDEQDCSHADRFWSDLRQLEAGLWPASAGCYLEDFALSLTVTYDNVAPADSAFEWLLARKGGTGRLALGVIGGVRPTGPTGKERSSAVAAECRYDGAAPQYDCACLASVPLEEEWCQLTANHSTTDPKCQALTGSRYVDLVSRVGRRTFDTICQGSFGPALEEFANAVTSACFDLDLSLDPAGSDPVPVKVVRTARAEQGNAAQPVELPQVDCLAEGPGWCFVDAVLRPAPQPSQPPQVCLVGLDRLVGDLYDISVLVTDYYDPNR